MLISWYQVIQGANTFMQHEQPREKYKQGNEQEAKDDLAFLLRVIKQLAIVSAPILIEGFEKIKTILGREELKKIDTTKTLDGDLFKKIFDVKEFPVVLKPEIVYTPKSE